MLSFVLIIGLLFALSTSLPLNSVEDKYQQEEDPEYGSHFEGDMILNQEQLMAATSSGRNGLIDLKYRWPNKTIPYQLSADHTQKQQDHIELALKTLESISCVKFVRRTDEVNYVELRAGDGGCFSSVGYQNRTQVLNLKKYEPGAGCFRLATIMHEFLHALGFYHMQSAYDRDEYVTIHWENLQEGTENNFNKYTDSQITHFNSTYDYYSVMHYGPNGFSKNGNATIVPTDEAYAKVIGQRLGLSPTDISKLNMMYECNKNDDTF